jgi:hypothetical protein
MTYTELVAEIRRLTAEERLALLEEIARSLQVESPPAPPAEQLRGMFRGDAPPPTDDEVKEWYVDYLLEKYR